MDSPFCGKTTVRRAAVGIWDCKGCKKTMTGGAYTMSYVSIRKPNTGFKGLTCGQDCGGHHHAGDTQAIARSDRPLKGKIRDVGGCFWVF